MSNKTYWLILEIPESLMIIIIFVSIGIRLEHANTNTVRLLINNNMCLCSSIFSANWRSGIPLIWQEEASQRSDSVWIEARQRQSISNRIALCEYNITAMLNSSSETKTPQMFECLPWTRSLSRSVHIFSCRTIPTRVQFSKMSCDEMLTSDWTSQESHYSINIIYIIYFVYIIHTVGWRPAHFHLLLME